MRVLHRLSHFAALVAGALAVVCALPAGAGASRVQVSVFQDDRALLLAGPQKRDRTLNEIAALGADTIHSIVTWSSIAPNPSSRRVPAGDLSNPANYPPGSFDRLDGLVRGAAARGLELILSPSSPIPRWASRCTRGSAHELATCRPDARRFGAFVTALGRRYSGTYLTAPPTTRSGGPAPPGAPPPSSCASAVLALAPCPRAVTTPGAGSTPPAPVDALPRVAQWSIWNEPNQPGWLRPQYSGRGRSVTPVSPVLYRSLLRAAIAGLAASGHRGDRVLLGETAPLGHTTGSPASRAMDPTTFYQALLCLDRRGRPLRGAGARTLGCSRFTRLAVTGIAHHPYTRGGSQPPTTPSKPNEITIASIKRLERIADQAASRGRLPHSLPIFFTEFGFQTNPPDRLFGVPLRNQATFLDQSVWIGYRDSRIASSAQYELFDETARGQFRTGLRFANGRAKPALASFPLPLWVTKAGSRVRVFGQVRPAAVRANPRVEIQNLAPRSRRFRTVRVLSSVNRRGFFLITLPARPGRWRLQATGGPGTPTLTSRVADTARR